MQMTVLIVFAVVLSFGAVGGPRVAQWGWLPLTALAGAYLLITAVVTWLLTRSSLARLTKGDCHTGPIIRTQNRHMMAVQLWMIAGIVALVLVGALDRIRLVEPLGYIPLCEEIVLLGIFLAAAIMYWRITYAFDRQARWLVEQDLMLAGLPVRAGWTARQHLSFNLRSHFLFVAVPVGLIMLAHDLTDRAFPPASAVAMGLKIAAVAGVFLISPMLLVRVWRTRKMPAGELRTRLQRLCDRIGLKYRQIRIWDTAGVVANAGVMGLHRSVRYILISDALLEQMDDRQIVAVFGHEAGHVKGRHMSYFLLFMVASLVGCMAVAAGLGLLAQRLAGSALWVDIVEQVVMAVLVAVAIGLGFGWLSRRFERQADVYGAWCASVDSQLNGEPTPPGSDLAAGGPAFIGALEDIARINGLARDGRNWRHGSIRTRVMFLIDWIGRGRSREDFDRQIARVKLYTWLGALAAILAAGLTHQRWM